MRKKLIELLRNAKAAMKAENLSCDIARNMFVVDFMMANGVTVQGWIPVTERLPECFGTYIVAIHEHHGENRMGVDSADFDPFAKTWNTFNYWCAGMEVTHWMPLPTPPKGE